jgi:very-short-patch-repair endonuclease/predicted transcriptional regulator of viral defense system
MLRRMAAPDHDECGFTARGGRPNRKVRLAALAERQVGRIRHEQLLALGVAGTTVRRWVQDGYLHRLLPRVYAVGHTSASAEGDLAAAVLYAGPGAMLSHATAAWWLGLLKYPPAEINVSTPRDVRDRGNVTVHGRRELGRVEHNGLPVTTPSQTLLDFAATGSRNLLRLALANADYNDMLDASELQRMMGRGIAGSAALRGALAIHLPQLARTRSEPEALLLELCERRGFPIPLVNEYLEGWLVDAYWPDRRLVVEIDGARGHRTPAQLQRDHQRDLELRLAGYVVLRYTRRQLVESPGAVAADLRRYL